MKLVKIGGNANPNLYRHPTTGIIYFRMYRTGRGEIMRSLKTQNLADARPRADEVRKKLFGTGPLVGRRKLVPDLFEAWLQRKEIKAPATYYRYRQSWNLIRPFVQNMLPEELDEAFWEGTLVPALQKALGPRRKFFNDRKTLMGFLLDAKRQGDIDRIPLLKNPDLPSRPGRVFTRDQVDRMLADAPPDLKLMILMAVTMGMRKGEIFNLQWDRIDFRERVIALRPQDTKIRRGRSFRISPEVWPLLAARHPNGKSFVFPRNSGENLPLYSTGTYKPWLRAKIQAGVKGRFHDLRHTFLTHAFKQAVNPALICDFAGLTLEVAHKHYLHFTADDTAVVAGLFQDDSSGKNRGRGASHAK